MKWLEISVKAPPEFVEPLSQIFYRYGCGGVAVEEAGGYNPDEGDSPPDSVHATVRTYLPLDSATDARRHRIDLGVRLVAQVCPISPLQERVLEQEEWEEAWKEHFHVLRVGTRIVVCPSWRSYEPGPADIVVTLDPGMAFGTGHHPTTRACLQQLETLVEPDMNVLDVGSGSGILSIAAAKLGASAVFGLEIDSVAVPVAEGNVRDNGVENTVRIVQGTLPSPWVQPGTFDIVVANISSKVINDLADELVKSVRRSGNVIASGLLEGRADEVAQRLRDAGADVTTTVVDGDWVTLVASRA